MKRRTILIVLLAWLPLGLRAEPFTYESPAELTTALDANDDGLADLVVVDRASGVRQLAVQQPDGSFAWAEPRSTGLDGVTALTAGRFRRDGSAEGFAVAAPSWNRVSVVMNPFDPEAYFNAMAPGIGPNLVVAIDMAGDAGLDDLAIATCWEDPPSDSRLYASAWNGITASSLYDLVAGQSGPLTHGNRARLTSAGPWLLGMMRPTGTTSEFLTRIPATLGYDVGPAATGLPPDATWVWGEFDASGHSQFLFYAPGGSALYARPVEAPEPGVLSFGSGDAFDLGEPIRQVCVLPHATGALLLVVFGDGATGGLYDFDGHNLPLLRQALSAPLGNRFTLAGALGDGDLLLLHGPAGGAGASTGWERWGLAGPQHLLTGSGALPASTPASGRANVLVYQQDPATNPDAEVQLLLQAGDWSVAADTIHAALDVTAERFANSTDGLGSPAVTGFSRRPSGFYVPGLNEISATVNQRSAAASVACLSPALGIPTGDIAFDPPSGAYPGVAAGGLTVRLQAAPDAPVHYRTDPSQPWALYAAANPPTITSNTTFWAYADNPTGFWYYDYTDYAWHYADTGMYGPIRVATYRIAAVPALEPAAPTDADGDGLGDAWAATFGLSDPLADADGDGADNRAEFAAGSDPLDPASLPTATVTYTVTFQPGAHGSLAGGTPAVAVTVNQGDPSPVAPAVTPDVGWLFSGWSPPLPATITAPVETTAQYTHTPSHQADQDGDWAIQLSPELTRLIQLYNSGAYHCDAGIEDGYAPEVGDTTCLPHQADQNGDWVIQLSPELTRLIQFHNLGGYHVEVGTEDGYAPRLSAGKRAPEPGALASVRQLGAPSASTMDVMVTLTHPSPPGLTSLAVQETLPAGWTFLGVLSSPAPAIVPTPGARGTLGFAWVKLPTTWPATLTYRVAVPVGSKGAKGLSGSASFRGGAGETVVMTAAAPSVDGMARGQGCFDLTGDYAMMIGANILMINMLHDTNGRLTGAAVLHVSAGKDVLPVVLSIRGTARSSGDALVATLAMQSAAAAGASRATLALDVSLDSAARQLVGRCTGSVSSGAVTTSVSQIVTLDLPAPMDGTWALCLEGPPGAREAAGTALLSLSNGVTHHLIVSGDATDPAALLSLAGPPPDPASRGIRITATVMPAPAGAPARLVVLSGRGYGQRLLP